jgi:4-hydroxybenzoate polyprenyltransferase
MLSADRLRTYAQLVRLPNVFTALADIGMAALAAGALPHRWLPITLIMLASACLYCGGMVWNDFFDVEQDRRERPFRPIPSGRVSRAEVGRLGAILLALGVLFALLAGQESVFDLLPAALACLLVVLILLYDAWLKHTWAGPLTMGSCRFGNVLLGLTSAGEPIDSWGLHLALLVGVYIVGVTWFARTEARASKQTTLSSAAMVMLAALLLAVPLPSWFEPPRSSPAFPYLLVLFGFLVGLPVWRAIALPTPERVQSAVKQAILGLIILDAVLATAFAGMVGLSLLALLPPALLLGRWIYST